MPPELQKKLDEKMLERELDRLVENELEYAHENNTRSNEAETLIEDSEE